MVFKLKVVYGFQFTYLHLTIFTLELFVCDVKVVHISLFTNGWIYTIHFGVCIHFEKGPCVAKFQPDH